MAREARRLRPQLAVASHCTNYKAFVVWHRRHLEQLPAFAPWDAELTSILEREAAARSLREDDRHQWDSFYPQVGGALHSAFWFAWEHLYHLKERYEAHMAAASQIPEADRVLRIGQQGQAPPAEGDLWNQVAKKVFDEMETEEEAAFWEMPEAESLGVGHRQQRHRQASH